MRDPLSGAPRSLLTGGNQVYVERASRLFTEILKSCDLPAVIYLARAILGAAYEKQREQQAAKKRQRKRGPHAATKQFHKEWKATYPREKTYLRADKPTLQKWIAELGQYRAKSDFEADQIRQYRNRLGERLAALDKTKRPSIREVRTKLATAVVDVKEGQDADEIVKWRLQRARKRSKPKRSGGRKKKAV
jgi:hypothetical protein